MARRDPNTQSNYDEVITKRIDISYDIDFEKKILAGSVVLGMKVLADNGINQVILDTR
jgi:leukotriene-A4 hydrolase